MKVYDALATRLATICTLTSQMCISKLCYLGRLSRFLFSMKRLYLIDSLVADIYIYMYIYILKYIYLPVGRSLKQRSYALTGDPDKQPHEEGSVEKMIASRANLRAIGWLIIIETMQHNNGD